MQYDLQSHLNKVYATFPEAKQQPIIGITTNFTDGDATLRDVYYKQIAAAGGIPVLVPPVATSIRSGPAKSLLRTCTTSMPSATCPN